MVVHLLFFFEVCDDSLRMIKRVEGATKNYLNGKNFTHGQ